MNTVKIMFMFGLPGSGKSNRAQELAEDYDAVILSSDEIRQRLLGNENDQTKNSYIFEKLHTKAKIYLKYGCNVIIDATNLNRNQRIRDIKMYQEYAKTQQLSIEKNIFIVDTPLIECLLRNKNRERHVPDDVIKRMYTYMQYPEMKEGWDNVFLMLKK